MHAEFVISNVLVTLKDFSHMIKLGNHPLSAASALLSNKFGT
jgi:hypothetical protein